jgi:hypothetical protein
MPSKEGDEVEVALDAGFRQQNIHIVDENAAIVATLKRTKYPHVNTHGMTVGRAAERIARRGIKITCANLDLTGQVSVRQSYELDRFAQSGCLSRESAVAVTMLRGRESRGVSEVMRLQASAISHVRALLGKGSNDLFDTDIARLVMSGRVLRGEIVDDAPPRVKRTLAIARAEKYKSVSGTQSMLFCVYYLRAPKPATWWINTAAIPELKALIGASQ